MKTKPFKLSEKQKDVIQLLRDNDFIICRFRGIGTRFSASVDICDKNSRTVGYKISIATVNKLRDIDLISETQRDFTHSYYSLSYLGNTITI